MKKNIFNKEKEIINLYSEIDTNIDDIEEYEVEDYVIEESEKNTTPSEKETKKKRFTKSNKKKSKKKKYIIEEQEDSNEIENFEVDEVKEYPKEENEEEKKDVTKIIKQKKKKKNKPKKVVEEYDLDTEEEKEIEEYEIEESNAQNIDVEEDSNFLEKNHIIKKINSTLIINIAFSIIFILIIMIVIDIVLVTRFERTPIFSIALKSYDDGGTKEYYGLGYKTIKYNQIQGRKDIELGTWSLKYDINPIYLDTIDLAIEVNDNEAKTYNKYYKKFLRVSGILSKIDSTDNTITISYIDDGGKYNLDVICKMDDDSIDLSKLELNNEITAIGTMNDYKFKSKDNNATIEMKNCFAEQ